MAAARINHGRMATTAKIKPRKTAAMAATEPVYVRHNRVKKPGAWGGT